MTRKSPWLTLAAGAALAIIMMILNVQADRTGQPGGYGSDEPASARTSAAATASPSASVAAVQLTFAGRVTGAGSSVAIAVHGATAVAYFCDGKKIEAWLQGTVTGTALALTGANGARLEASFAAGKATGSVTAAGKTWAFQVGEVRPPSGLYRSTANVRGATVVSGWIVLADGTQVGVARVGDLAQAAPALDTATGTAVLDGTIITAIQVDGSGL